MAVGAATAQDTLAPVPRRSGLGRTWRRFRRNRQAVLGLILVGLQFFVVIFAPWLAPYDPYASDYTASWQTPNAVHLLGTDDLGRDVLSRLIYGTRVSLGVGVLSQLILVLLGVPAGALAGLLGKWVDFIIMRVIDVLSSLPALLFYILLMVALGAGFVNIILAMAITGWIGIARLVRGQVLSLKETDYVRAARAMGAGTGHIIMTHLIRNTLTPVIVTVTLGIPGAMFAEAGLSFLGLGVPPPTPSWGQMIGLYQGYLHTAWHLTVFPAIVLAIAMLGWVFMGDGLRDALDPYKQMPVDRDAA